MSVKYFKWSSLEPGPPYDKTSPNIRAIYGYIKAKFPGVSNLGSYGVRPIKSGNPGETRWSSHAFGSAIDIGCGTELSLQVIDFLIANHQVLGVQMIIDYKRKRTWKSDRLAWKLDPNMHSGGGSWIHIETSKEEWNNGSSIDSRLTETSEVRILKLTFPNMRGEDVKKLQEALNKHLPMKLDADGIFGNKTDASVRSFQTLKGIYVDGLVGSQTWSKLL
jgi:hypothetical protein